MSAKLDTAQKKDTDETKPTQTGETIVEIPLDELFPLRGHPFSVNDDDLMEQTVASIKSYGVLLPAIVRPREDGGYEIIAGHRRHHACGRAGLTAMPCVVRNVDYDTAVILMVDSNRKPGQDRRRQAHHRLPGARSRAQSTFGWPKQRDPPRQRPRLPGTGQGRVRCRPAPGRRHPHPHRCPGAIVQSGQPPSGNRLGRWGGV